MFSPNHLDLLLKKIMDQMGVDVGKDNTGDKNNQDNQKNNCPKLAPSQILVILGLFTGVFEVTSVLVDNTQQVQIVLSGSLKRKTQLEKMMDQIGEMPFDDVMKAVIGRYD